MNGIATYMYMYVVKFKGLDSSSAMSLYAAPKRRNTSRMKSFWVARYILPAINAVVGSLQVAD